MSAALPGGPLRRLGLDRRRGRARRRASAAAARSIVAAGARARCRPSSRGASAASRSTARRSPRCPARRSTSCGATSASSTSASTTAAACGSSATSAPARRRSRCSSRKTALEAGRIVAIYSLPRLLAEIRATFDDGSRGAYTDLLTRLAEVDLLHIDDLGAEKTSDWVLEQLYAIVNDRYEAERSIVVTTNLDRDELRRADRRAHRLAARGDVRRVPAVRRDTSLRGRDRA